MENLYAFTTCGSGSIVSVVTTLGVSLAIPNILVACNSGIFLALRLIDGQVENLYAFTTCGSGSIVGVVTAFGVCNAIPYILIACYYGVFLSL